MSAGDAAQALNLEGIECDAESETAVAAALGAAASAPVKLLEGDLETVYAIRDEVFPVQRERPRREHEADSVESLVAMATDHSAVWHRGDRVVLVIDNRDESHRRDTVVWCLTATEAASAAAEPGRWVSQKDVIDLLQRKLRKPVRGSAEATQVLQLVQSIKWSRSENAASSVGRGSESMDRDLVAKAQGVENTPEEFLLTVPRWAELANEFAIELLFDVDVMEQRFRVGPTVDEARKFELVCQGELAAFVGRALAAAGKADVPVYAGCP